MVMSRIDIDLLGQVVDELGRVIDEIPVWVFEVRCELDDVRLYEPALERWRSTGWQLGRLVEKHKDLSGRLDKAKQVDAYGAGVTFGVDPGGWRPVVLPGVVSFEEGGLSNFGDADVVAAWLVGGQLDSGVPIPPDILAKLRAGSVDAAFG